MLAQPRAGAGARIPDGQHTTCTHEAEPGFPRRPGFVEDQQRLSGTATSSLQRDRQAGARRRSDRRTYDVLLEERFETSWSRDVDDEFREPLRRRTDPLIAGFSIAKSRRPPRQAPQSEDGDTRLCDRGDALHERWLGDLEGVQEHSSVVSRTYLASISRRPGGGKNAATDPIMDETTSSKGMGRHRFPLMRLDAPDLETCRIGIDRIRAQPGHIRDRVTMTHRHGEPTEKTIEVGQLGEKLGVEPRRHRQRASKHAPEASTEVIPDLAVDAGVGIGHAMKGEPVDAGRVGSSG